jgi:hypothetical protein
MDLINFAKNTKILQYIYFTLKMYLIELGHG